MGMVRRDGEMNDRVLRVHHFLPRSHANGPGVRAVLWAQGCSLACPGCFNADTHALTGGERVLEQAAYVLMGQYCMGEVARSEVLPGFEVSVGTIFPH